MNINLVGVTVDELAKDYEDNDEAGVLGYGGKLDIRPPYQREFVYDNKQRDAVIDTVVKGYPLNVMYWAVRDDGGFEIIDGQQRTVALCQYVSSEFAFEGMYFHNLQDDQQQKILDYQLTIYQCTGTDSEKLKWFETINIAGEELFPQELRNAVYHGSWVSDAKRYFSKTGCPAYQIGSDYLRGSTIRQDYLATAIRWISDGDITGYMGLHQKDPDAKELWKYFQSVIKWVTTTFPSYYKDMKGLPWGPLYDTYGTDKLDPVALDAEVKKLRADVAVKSNKGVYEYLLGGKNDHKLLLIRVFDDRTKAIVYEQQTQKAKAAGVSNCPHCAIGHDANKTRIYEPDEMDADHVTAWSKGGDSDIKNCEMLCVTHNRAKGNR